MVQSQQSEELLRKISFFRDLERTELEKIQHLLIQWAYSEKMNIFLQGDPLKYVYFIMRGKVKIFRADEHGREQIVNILQEGDMFPHKGFFHTAEYPANAVMIERGILFALPTASFRNLLETNPSLCIRLLAIMEARLTELQDRLEEIVLHDVAEQIIYMLMRLAQRHGVSVGERIWINVPFTNQELANMIGTSRETVNRTLNQLKKIGALRITTGHHLLLDMELLEKRLHAKPML
ncbi:Crp/Fnr family transcriptional regulator [Fodinisporobacter ferrooxydans]|uniref:Crp/Fnr family transcriptional regulator n=1 Tax=Fodinisporobacter ferrooxydans TaxID=2901836 RepID=A0ABY4CVZ2_9BACL|nr:Crp/Fnr family transcriptional regulator [Alicyclobacillaceae bacterium MYW30-H2]